MCLVPRRGLEPPRLAALVPETSASTNSATWARAGIGTERSPGCQFNAMAPVPVDGGFTKSPALCAFPVPGGSGIMALYIAKSMRYARSR